MKKIFYIVLFYVLIPFNFLFAENSIENFPEIGLGKGSYLGFGDSITYGVGDVVNATTSDDGKLPETDGRKGYIQRLESFLKINAKNGGIPGEELVAMGIERLPSLLLTTTYPVIGILEGSNDGFQFVSKNTFSIALQKAVNIIIALGKKPLLFTLPPPCCNHLGLAPFSSDYSFAIQDIAARNQLVVADIRRAWQILCPIPEQCPLTNLPDGLHPTPKGYDLIAQIAAASLLGIDIFAAGGAAELESALGLAKGIVYNLAQ